MANNELAKKITQYLLKQIEPNSELSSDAKESLAVAVDCIEQAYNFDRLEPSNELADIYGARNNSPSLNSIIQMVQQIAPNLNVQSIIDQFTGVTSEIQQQSQQSHTTTTDPPTSQPKDRKVANETEKRQAEIFKNEGNEFMKQDQYKEAYDSYTKAIELDGQNAVYYSNRAAASSKMNDHTAALSDCKEAIEIDPNYSKAYGRMGLAYVSLNNHKKAKDAYVKAVQLDPENESYQNNLKVAEEKLAQEANQASDLFRHFFGTSSNGSNRDMPNIFGQDGAMGSLLGNPDLMNQMAGVLGMFGGNNQRQEQQDQQPPPGTS